MRKIDQLRDQMQRVRALLLLMPATARDALTLTMETIEEQQQSIDNLTAQVNRLTEGQGDK